MSKYAVTTAAPLLRVRNAANRNQRRLNKRLSRLATGTLRVERDNGTLELFRVEDLETFTVKREAQRAAKRSGGRFLVLK